ncbi:hypothetical protein Tco_1113183 [Tanacetum coccineum]|uniref:Uncharacterized protein n=1 Tax=Tanacetum coccineum TaxID=301880 RepID=A0ABQ5ISZ2_9ASTR
MYGFKECSSYGALYNREHCCSNVSSVDNFVRDHNPISYDETPDSSQQPPRNCSKCGEKQHQPEDIQELLRKLLKDLQIISEELADYIDTLNRNCPAFYDNDDEDDDEEYTIAITPVLPTMEPNNSLSMGDEHLNTIPEKKESSVEDLVPIPSESKGISDSMCDMPFCKNSHPLDALKDHYEIFFDPNDDYASSDYDPLYSKDIDYVDASPPDSELISLDEVKDFDTKDEEIDTDILLTTKDDILCKKLLNINLLICRILVILRSSKNKSEMWVGMLEKNWMEKWMNVLMKCMEKWNNQPSPRLGEGV